MFDTTQSSSSPPTQTDSGEELAQNFFEGAQKDVSLTPLPEIKKIHEQFLDANKILDSLYQLAKSFRNSEFLSHQLVTIPTTQTQAEGYQFTTNNAYPLATTDPQQRAEKLFLSDVLRLLSGICLNLQKDERLTELPYVKKLLKGFIVKHDLELFDDWALLITSAASSPWGYEDSTLIDEEKLYLEHVQDVAELLAALIIVCEFLTETTSEAANDLKTEVANELGVDEEEIAAKLLEKTSHKSSRAESEGGGSDGEAELEVDTSDQTPSPEEIGRKQATVPPEQVLTRPNTLAEQRENVRQLNYEAQWVYGRLLFELQHVQGLELDLRQQHQLRLLVVRTMQNSLGADELQTMLAGKSPGARLRVLSKVYRQLQTSALFTRLQVRATELAPTTEGLSESAQELLGVFDPRIGQSLSAATDGLVLAYGDKVSELLQSFDPAIPEQRQKLALLLGLGTVSLTQPQAEALISLVQNFAFVRLTELIVTTRDAQQLENGLVGVSSDDFSVISSGTVGDFTRHFSDHSSTHLQEKVAQLQQHPSLKRLGFQQEAAGLLVGQAISRNSNQAREVQKDLQRTFQPLWQSLSRTEQILVYRYYGLEGQAKKYAQENTLEALPLIPEFTQFNLRWLEPMQKAIETGGLDQNSELVDFVYYVVTPEVLVQQEAELLRSALVAELEYQEQVLAYLQQQQAAAIAAEYARLEQEFAISQAVEVQQQLLALEQEMALAQSGQLQDYSFNEIAAAQEQVAEQVGTTPSRSGIRSRFGRWGKQKASSTAKDFANKKIQKALKTATGQKLKKVVSSLGGPWGKVAALLADKNGRKLLAGALIGTGVFLLAGLQKLLSSVGGAVGGLLGGAIGGFLGSFVGPLGTAAGIGLGASAGAHLGSSIFGGGGFNLGLGGKAASAPVNFGGGAVEAASPVSAGSASPVLVSSSGGSSAIVGTLSAAGYMPLIGILTIGAVTFHVFLVIYGSFLTPTPNSTQRAGLTADSFGCLEFGGAGAQVRGGTSKDWTLKEQQLILDSMARNVGNNACFMNRVCPNPSDTVTLYRLDGREYGGWAVDANTLGFYDAAFESKSGKPYGQIIVEYTLVHELGHIIDKRNSNLRREFVHQAWGGSQFTYPYPEIFSQGEAFAEALVLTEIWSEYIFPKRDNNPIVGRYNFEREAPTEYKWMVENIYCGSPFTEGVQSYLAFGPLTTENILVSNSDEIAGGGQLTCDWRESQGATVAINANYFNTKEDGTLVPVGVAGHQGDVSFYEASTIPRYNQYLTAFGIIGGSPKFTSTLANLQNSSGWDLAVTGLYSEGKDISTANKRTALGVGVVSQACSKQYAGQEVLMLGVFPNAANGQVEQQLENCGADQIIHLDGGGSSNFCSDSGVNFRQSRFVPVNIGMREAEVITK